jgi:hypothetical protein
METKFTHQDSLDTISQMIHTAKGNVQEGSFYFLLWGWVVAFCNFSNYILLAHTDFQHPFMVWLLTIPAAIISGIYGARKKRQATFTTYYDRLYGLIWMGIGISIVVVIIFGSKINFFINPVILLMAGTGTFLSGNLLRFKPLVWGGAALWVSAVIAFMLPVALHYLVGGIAIVLGYLVPAYLLKNQKNG